MVKKDISKYVGGRIREIRKKRNLTQKELGEKIGVKHNTISSYENGTNEPEHDILFKLANVLDVSIDDFFPATSVVREPSSTYDYYPASISAGEPEMVDVVTENDVQKITITDRLMSKWSGKDVFVMKVNGESMNNIMPDGSLIVVSRINSEQLKNGDIVVYKYDNEFAVKRFYRNHNKLIFRPDSDDPTFTDLIIDVNNNDCDIVIEGKVVMYIVNLD